MRATRKAGAGDSAGGEGSVSGCEVRGTRYVNLRLFVGSLKPGPQYAEVLSTTHNWEEDTLDEHKHDQRHTVPRVPLSRTHRDGHSAPTNGRQTEHRENHRKSTQRLDCPWRDVNKQTQHLSPCRTGTTRYTPWTGFPSFDFDTHVAANIEGSRVCT